MSDIAIKVENLSKKYRLGTFDSGVLFKDIQSWIAIKRGKENPHSKIGHNKFQTVDGYFWALKDISFDIKQGDRVGIIGKNGAGKSTLLKILSRITAPTEGIAKIKGKVASLLEVGTGFHGELSGRENIYLNGAILGMKKRRIDELLDKIIDFSGIEHYIDTPVKRYSSGMYVRLAFAVAAHLDSDILIADEVLAVGDADFQKKALGKMQDLSTGQGRTVLFVSHNMGSVKILCDTSILMQEGSIIFSGKTSDVINYYQSNRKFENNIVRENINTSIYINSILTCDTNSKEKKEFLFSEDIHLRIGITIKTFNPIMVLTIAFLSSDETKIFTDNNFLNNFCNGSSNEIVVDYIIKAGFIAPGSYSFIITISDQKGSIVYDSLYDICQIKICDDGTDFAYIEGKFHYGYFIVKNQCEWKLIS